jgi:glycosyltransferase involved in cell wall biosynthesis
MITVVSKKLKSLSVFFPVFNEEENLEKLAVESLEIIPQIAQKYEIIFVNDGSTDNSRKVIEKLRRNNNNIRLINHPKNLGYGECLKTGIKNSKYEWIFWTDADLQFRLKELNKFIKFIDKKEAIIGFRKERAEGLKREINARLFKFYIDLLFRLNVKDIDCAFKLIKAEELKDLELNSGSAFTSAEILYRLKKNGVKFKEIGVKHYPRLFGKATGSNLKVILKACYEAMHSYLNIKFFSLQSKHHDK